MTLYLKYRPQIVDELDIVSVRDTLKKVLASENMPHAFLFAGPKGTGKTSSARILAKYINCSNPKKGVPCGECSECKSIISGGNIDVIEIDAASHRGIDDIRSLVESVKLAPSSAKKKIYIIDEAHMLTAEASNALLKTLEEPPSHVIFVLATTNPEKLIDTIKSRTTLVQFNKATVKEIEESLKRVVKGEKIEIQEDLLGDIARASGGSFRDAVKTLESIVADTHSPSKDDVDRALGLAGGFDLDKFVEYLINKDTKELFSVIEKSFDSGVSTGRILSVTLIRLRNILKENVRTEANSKNKEIGILDLIRLIELFNDAYSKLQGSYLEEIPLEIAIIKWCEGSRVEDNKSGRSEVEDIGQEITVKKVENHTSGKSEEKSEKLDKSNESIVEVNAKTEKIDHQVAKKKLAPDSIKESEMSKLASQDKQVNTINDEVWEQIVSRVRDQNASTMALLRASKPIGMKDNSLTLAVYYKFHKEHLESNHHRQILEKVCEEIFGNTTKISCILTDPPIANSESTILNEPKIGMSGNIPTNALTNDNSPDIIDIAKEIFNS